MAFTPVVVTHQTVAKFMNRLGEDQDRAHENQIIKRKETLKIR